MFVLFHCPTCKTKGKVKVAERAIAVDIRLWLDRCVMSQVKIIHNIMSPKCLAEKVDLALPVDKDGDRLGKIQDESKFTADEANIFRDLIDGKNDSRKG